MSISRYDIKTEGKEPYQKTMSAFKAAMCGTAITSTYAISRPLTYPSGKASVVLTMKHAFKWTAVTTAFTTTVLFLTNVRKKDDPWNYFLGANASCAVIYSITRNPTLAFSLAIWSGVGAALLKAAFLDGYDPLDFSGVPTNRYRGCYNFDKCVDVRYQKRN